MSYSWSNSGFIYIPFDVICELCYGPVAYFVPIFTWIDTFIIKQLIHETFLNRFCQFWLLVVTLEDWFNVACLSSYYKPNVQSNKCANCSFDREVQYINTKLPCILTSYACVSVNQRLFMRPFDTIIYLTLFDYVILALTLFSPCFPSELKMLFHAGNLLVQR